METIKKAILLDLQQGKRLTVLDGLLLYKTMELRKRISELRAEGNVINDRWVSKNKKKFKEYFISKPTKFTCFVSLPAVAAGSLTTPECMRRVWRLTFCR